MLTKTFWLCRACSWSLPRKRLWRSTRYATTTTAANRFPLILLERAKKLAAEHDELNSQIGAEYDEKIAKRVGELSRIAEIVKELEAAEASLTELQGLLNSDDAELRQLAQDDLDETQTLVHDLGRKLSVALVPKDPYADMPCLLEIRPGPGGMEGRFFADSLTKMYQAYCLNQGYSARVVKYELCESEGMTGADGEQALQEAVLEIQDNGSYGRFRGEAGMHRVQRVPATEKTGRTHTSAAAVWVLPSFPEQGSDTENDFDNPDSDFYVDPSEVECEKMRARGAGGQHVNKTESAIRLTHVPTGTTVSMQDSRSQHRNREYAWRLLRSRLAQQRREAKEEEARQLRRSVLSQSQITRGDKIRTYNYGQNRVTDHRSGLDIYNLPNVMQGGDMLIKIMDSVAVWLTERAIQVVVSEEQAAIGKDGTGRRK